MRCEGWTRRGGVFTFGPVTWTQCPNKATKWLHVRQTNSKTGELEETAQPSCDGCVEEAKKWPIEILKIEPLVLDETVDPKAVTKRLEKSVSRLT